MRRFATESVKQYEMHDDLLSVVNISYKCHLTNEEVRKKIRDAVEVMMISSL